MRGGRRGSIGRTRLRFIVHQSGYSTGGRRGQGCDLPFMPVQGIRSGRGSGRPDPLSQVWTDFRRQGGEPVELRDGQAACPRCWPAARRPRPRTRRLTTSKACSPCHRLVSRACSRPPAALEPQSSGPSPMLLAMLGVGGVALVAIVALVVVLTRPGPVPAGGGGGGGRGAGRCSIAKAR